MKNLQKLLRGDQIKTDSDALAAYGRDWCKEFEAAPSAIVFPESTAEVQAVVVWANDTGKALVPSGGRTGLSGGATALSGEVVVSLERMSRILESDATARLIRCQAGLVTEKLQEEARALDLYFPVEFASQASSQIGGNIATNVGGIHVVRYGNMRDWVIGLSVVTGTGELLELNGSLMKNRTGYDLASLMIGSEGTLGIITEATLRLTSYPKDKIRVLCGLTTYDRVLELLKETRDNFEGMSAFEYFSRLALDYVLKHTELKDPFPEGYEHYVLVEIEVDSHSASEAIEEVFFALLEKGLVPYVVIGQNSKQSRELLEIRERIGEVLASHYMPHKNDIAVPVSKTTSFLDKLNQLCATHYSEYDVVVFGHIGDGNFHINVVKPETMKAEEFSTYCHQVDNELFKLVQEFSGSISAEHGVGLLKKDFLSYSRTPHELTLMRQIKQVFDPKGILNPGKIFDM